MHGRKRETLDESRARREASLPKVRLIRALQDDAIRRRREKVYDATSMAVTARLLEINPEVLTAWNFRREAIISAFESERRGGAPSTPLTEDHETPVGPSAHTSEKNARGPGNLGTLADELLLTERCLRKHPKSYPTWHHRKWCVARFVSNRGGDDVKDEETISSVSTLLSTELSMSRTLLDLDDRNFHGWGYRRFVVKLMGSMSINKNRERKSDEASEASEASALSELRYSQDKIEKNFSNYSAWHHRAAYLPRAFKSGKRETLKAKEGETPAETLSHRRDEKNMSPSPETPETVAENPSSPGSNEQMTGNVPERILADEYELVRQAFFTEPEDQAGWMYHRWLTAQTARFRAEGNEAAKKKAGAVFAGEADALAELCELEPECKWPVLTLARLCDLRGTDEGAAESAARFDQLAKLDPTRRGFYCDCGGRR